MSIEFKDGAVCFADNRQWSFNDSVKPYKLVSNMHGTRLEGYSDVVDMPDFQLNTIKQGDYIEASEFDTEQKYNDAVEVFGLFGFDRVGEFCLGYADFMTHPNESALICSDGLLMGISKNHSHCKRKVTFNQLMVIGELKRLEVERDKREVRGCFVDALGEAVAHAEKLEDEWTDKHYNNFYQLTEEDIKTGQIKVDAYFVNRMWKINQWDDTGAGFHILKTLPRIANNKNTLKRELVALKKQVDILCRLHGVDDGDLK